MDIDPKHVAGPLGALSAVLFLKGTVMRRLAMVIPGAALSFYAAPWVAQRFNTAEGLAGFLVGLFGMAAVGKVFDTWENLAIADLITAKLRQWFGVKGSE